MLLRRWQQRALFRLDNINKTDFLVVATPGSGKTLLALRVAHKMLREGQVERMVVVCPTDHLRKQWAAADASIGLDIDPLWSNADGVEALDYYGVVVTYQQVSFAPDLYRLNCAQRTLVIFDEIHHAGDDLAWGTKLREAFGPATFRLSISGTPFRSDNNPIPFITYLNGRSHADFEYGYKDALADGVCRPIYFPSFEGRVKWLSFDGEIEDYSLLDPIARVKASERLRAALWTEGEWMRGVLCEANNKLTAIRVEGHTDASGLVIATDQDHAKRIGCLLHKITKVEPFIAISESPDASERIKRFAKNNARWIVAVKMISEGVDIPRLRVGVYATNIQSELFFRQAVGRFVRMIEGLDEQSASLYLPADPILLRYALQIKQERDHFLTQNIEKLCNSTNQNSGRDEYQETSIFAPLDSDIKPYSTIFDGAAFDAADLSRAEAVGREMGLNIPHAQVAAILRRGAAASGRQFAAPTYPPQQNLMSRSVESIKAERKLLLRKSVQRLTNRLARLLSVEPREVHREWISLDGPRHGQATEEDLERKKKWLIERIRGTQPDNRPVAGKHLNIESN
jgi:superfamily II DNA or RNA helicase